jgi:hypothetical protein
MSSNTCTRCGATDLVVVLVVATAKEKNRPRVVDRLCPACWRAGREDGSIDGGR